MIDGRGPCPHSLCPLSRFHPAVHISTTQAAPQKASAVKTATIEISHSEKPPIPRLSSRSTTPAVHVTLDGGDALDAENPSVVFVP